MGITGEDKVVDDILLFLVKLLRPIYGFGFNGDKGIFSIAPFFPRHSTATNVHSTGPYSVGSEIKP